MDNASALPVSSWSIQLREQMQARPLTAIGLLIALAAVLLLLLQSLIMLAAGDISPGARYGLIGGLAGFAATTLGALPALFLREGALLPLGPVMEYSGEKPLTELELLVNPDDKGTAAGLLYEDAGEGFGYRSGEFRVTRFRATTQDGRLKAAPEVIAGSWQDPGRTLLVVPVSGTPAR